MQARTTKEKYKIIKLTNGVQYVGRLNMHLSPNETVRNLKFSESAKIRPCKDVVKLSLKAPKPRARDFYNKFVYEQVRNK